MKREKREKHKERVFIPFSYVRNGETFTITTPVDSEGLQPGQILVKEKGGVRCKDKVYKSLMPVKLCVVRRSLEAEARASVMAAFQNIRGEN